MKEEEDFNVILDAHHELLLSKKGRARKLQANPGTAPSKQKRLWSLDAETETAFQEAGTLIKELLNLNVSQSVIIRAAIQALHIKLLNLVESGQTARTNVEKQVQLSRLFLLRALLYKAAQQKIGK